jgi:chemotaxis protein methyltransferase CheR
MPKYSLPDEQLLKLSNIVANRLGLHFPKERWHDLEQGIRLTVQQTNQNDLGVSIQSLISTPLSKKQLEILASNLTIGETYFFRDRKFFDVLESHILPDLIDERRGKDQHLRIWCAGCCTGEEPYSIAILLHQVIPDLSDWNITILATDINPHFLAKMEAGVYSEWSFRDVPNEIKEKYFTRAPNKCFEILKSIKRMITPSYHNLVEDCYPSLLNNTNAMDIIICRNVLMYFTPENAGKVIKGFYRSLVEGGWLIVGPSEVSQTLFTQFTTEYLPEAILYKKDGSSPSIVSIYNIQPEPTVEPEFADEQKVVDEPYLPDEQQAPIQLNVEQEIPQPITSLYFEAQALNERGQYVEAMKKLAEYFNYNYNDANAHALLARVYANQGKLREAFAWCEKAISLDKINPAHYYLLAAILQEQVQFEEAIVSLKRAIYLDYNFVLAHVALGNITARLGNIHESRRCYRNALALLQRCRPEVILPDADGITVRRLIEVIQAMGTEEI